MTGEEYKALAEAKWGASWKVNAAAWHGVSIRTVERWVASLHPITPDAERSIRWAMNTRFE